MNSADELFEAKGRAIYLQAEPSRTEILDEGLKKRDDVERAVRELLLAFFALPAKAV